MGAGFGGTDADGLWTQHDSFEILEHALTHHLQFGPYPLRSLADVGAACDLLDRLPTQTVRSEEQIEWQQFSTPVDLAAVAFVLAAIRPDDIILERSEEHTSELQSLMRISYAVFCLKKKRN